METSVKTPQNRRTKFVLIGLVAVICVLCFQLYKVNNIKSELVSRKSFLIRRLHECRVDSEETLTKYRNKRHESERLTKDLEAKNTEYEQMSQKYQDLEKLYESETRKLTGLQQSASESQSQLSVLKENYDAAMSSAKQMEGKLDEAITVCKKHKDTSLLLNMTVYHGRQNLEACRKENEILKSEKEVLQENEERLNRKIDQILLAKRTLGENIEGSPVVRALGRLSVTQTQEPSSVSKTPSAIIGKLQNGEYVHELSDQRPNAHGQSTEGADHTRYETAVLSTPTEEKIQASPEAQEMPRKLWNRYLEK